MTALLCEEGSYTGGAMYTYYKRKEVSKVNKKNNTQIINCRYLDPKDNLWYSQQKCEIGRFVSGLGMMLLIMVMLAAIILGVGMYMY
jgi:hypothetical protein